MNYSDYANLIASAEAAMIAKGKATIDERLYMLGGIYYATTWSYEYSKNHADDRRKAFERCLHKTYSPADDPRPVIGPGLYTSLFNNQDVSGPNPVDMGHLLIGLAARLDPDARTQILYITDLGGIPHVPFSSLSTKSTGLEILTWVGDLGGAAGRLALDRAKAAATPGASAVPIPASKYFTGVDYGGPSNLWGDVYSYALAPGLSGTLDRPAIGPPLTYPVTVADAFKTFFAAGPQRAKACNTFLASLGGVMAAGSLTNQSAVQTAMADKFEAFGYFYMFSYLKTFVVKPSVPPPPAPSGGGYLDKLKRYGEGLGGAAAGLAGDAKAIYDQQSAAVPFLRKAAEDVAALFMKKLLANNLN